MTDKGFELLHLKEKEDVKTPQSPQWRKGSEIIKLLREVAKEHYGSKDFLGRGDIMVFVEQECFYLKDKVVVPEEKWLKIKDILEEIVFLYNEYGLEDDSKLTKDAIKLKNRILAVKDDFKLEKLKELIKG